VVSRIQFNDYDSVINSNTNAVEKVNAPKTFERLEEISTASAMRKMEEDEDDDSDKIRITDDDIKLDDLGIFDFDNTGRQQSPVVQDINFQLDIDELPAY
jgi:predicted transcriptional regulator